ncbi:hypothetical protein G6514_008303 [Epicoccum nigrum]|nr:hypothetical protein G6514_008303 [Epicoccum nigrum]
MRNTRQWKGPKRHRWKKDDNPFVTFQFKYRSLAILQSLGLVARNAGPQELPGAPSISTLGNSDMLTAWMSKTSRPAKQHMANIELPSRAIIDSNVSEDLLASAPAELVHCTAAEEERPPTAEHERPPTPAEISDGFRPATEQRTLGLELTPSGGLGGEMPDSASPITLCESMAAGNQHMANTEDVAQHLHLSPEHEDRSSPQALLVSPQISDQGVDNEDLEPPQVSERTIASSPSPTQLHRSNSVIEDNKPEVEFLCSRIASTSTQHHGLTTQEIIVILAGYRGHESGLAGLRRKALLSLLKSYEEQDENKEFIKQELTADSYSAAHVKREYEASGSPTGVRKRSKQEAIVLDD